MSTESTSLEECQAALTTNGFDVYPAKNPAHARQIFFEEILPVVESGLVSWADSMTMQETGVLASGTLQEVSL